MGDLPPAMSSVPPPTVRAEDRGVGFSRLAVLGWLALLVVLGWGLGHLLPGPKQADTPSPAVMAREPEKIPDEVVFSATEDRPESTPVLLPVTAVPLYCHYRFERWPKGTPLRATWRLGAQDLGELPLEGNRPEGGGTLSGRFLIRPPQGAAQFPPGIYQVTFHSDTQAVVESSFVMAVEAEKILTQQAPPAGEIRVVSLVTCTGLDAQGKPQGIARQFRPTDKIVAFFTYLNGVKQARFEVRWLAQDTVIPQATQQVEMKAGAGQAYAWLQAAGSGLPEGNYQVQVLLAGQEQPLAATPFAVSKAAAPARPPAGPPPSGPR